MRESATYQLILDEGRQEGRQEGQMEILHAMILRQGTKRFGPAEANIRQQLESITAVPVLEALTERLLEVESWAELLGPQAEA